MAVTNEQITSWLQSNPGATDATIASTMQQFGVTPAQMAQATGLDTSAVQARYDAAIAPAFAPAPVPAPAPVAQAGITTLPMTKDITVGQPMTGAVANTAPITTSAPSYQGLTATSTPEEIARAYYKFVSDAGGDTTANQNTARTFLENLGITAPTITGAYKDYNELTGLASSFGAQNAQNLPTQEGILSGFRYANEKGLDENTMKQVLGDDAFNTYKTGFADFAKTGIASILADNKLSFDEAGTAVKFGRDYGYDAQKLADLTGTDKKVFDAIYKKYDEDKNKVINSVLKADDVKTPGDQINLALALGKKYGFSDEDFSKATGLSLNQVKGFLDPVRNFESDYKKLLEDPNRSEDQLKTFLTSSLQNPFLKEKLGDKLQPALDELNRPPRERLLDQIGQQRKVLGDNFYRGVFGNPEVITEVLEKKGVKSLADLGEKDKFESTAAEKRYTTADGIPVEDLGNGTFGTPDGSVVPRSQVKTNYGYTTYETSPDGESQVAKFNPLSDKEVDKDGNYQKKVGTVVVNKRTGDELTDTDHRLALQSSSGGLKKKSNSLNVKFDKNGNAVLVASSERAGLGGLAQDLAPMISMALPFVLPGLGAGLSNFLPGAGVAASGTSAAIAPTLMNKALTQGIISGGLGALSGQDVVKSFLSGAVNPVINTGISSLLPAGINPEISRAVTGAGTNAIRGALQGGSFKDLLGEGILSGITNYGLGEVTKGLNLTPQQLNFATGIALPLIQGQKVNPINAIGSLAQMGQQQTKGKTP